MFEERTELQSEQLRAENRFGLFGDKPVVRVFGDVLHLEAKYPVCRHLITNGLHRLQQAGAKANVWRACVRVWRAGRVRLDDGPVLGEVDRRRVLGVAADSDDEGLLRTRLLTCQIVEERYDKGLIRLSDCSRVSCCGPAC